MNLWSCVVHQASPGVLCRAMIISCSLMLAGCGGEQQAAAQRESSHLKPLVVIYGQYLARTGQPPPSEEVFKKFVAERGTPLLTKIGIDVVDDVFVSERDGQPYVVVYGSPPEGLARDLVAYEQTGVDGKRLVGYSLGLVAEVDEDEFRELVRKEDGSP